MRTIDCYRVVDGEAYFNYTTVKIRELFYALSHRSIEAFLKDNPTVKKTHAYMILQTATNLIETVLKTIKPNE